jgi:hypothetical protein
MYISFNCALLEAGKSSVLVSLTSATSQLLASSCNLCFKAKYAYEVTYEEAQLL